MSELTLEILINDIQGNSSRARAAARDGAGAVGAKAIAPLAEIAASGELEPARAAQRAIQNIVYHAGRPGSEDEAKAVALELIALLDSSHPLQRRRDALWMIWQIAGDEAVESVASLLDDDDLFEDAVMALERLPGEKATSALQTAFDAAAESQKSVLAHSLRVRGVATSDTSDLRLKPTKSTAVTPVGS